MTRSQGSIERPAFSAFIDESVVDRWGALDTGSKPQRVGRRLLIGAAVTSEPGLLNHNLQQEVCAVVADGTMWDPRGGNMTPDSRRKRFEKEGFHLTFDSPPIRDRGLKTMLDVDIRFHVFYSNLVTSEFTSGDTHVAMLFTMVHSLLRRYAGSDLTFVFENANADIEQLYGPIVARATEFLDAAEGGKGVSRATAYARIGRKPLGGLAAADYAIGLTNFDLGQNKEPALEHDQRLLLRAAPHVAHIMDFDRAIHRRRFDTIDRPSWARHIVGASSHPGVAGAIPNLIPKGSTGPFTFWTNAAQLAIGLGYTPAALNIVRKKASQESSYSFIEAKIKGKTRHFTVTEDASVEDAQRRISYLLNLFSDRLHPSCSAYVPGRGADDAARPHVGKAWAQRLDIKDFFDSTDVARVRETLKWLGAVDEIAVFLADILTFKGRLPTGARTSPMMSNLVLAAFDFEIAAWAYDCGLSYSRYADDLVFSGHHEFDVSEHVANALRPLGYELNLEKSKLKRQGQPFRVAGLTIEAGGPRVRKTLKRKLRLELFLLNAALASVTETPSEGQSAVSDLDQADQHLFERTRGLARYCVGIEFDWTMRLSEKFPYADAAIWVSKKPGASAKAVHRLAEQIRSSHPLRLSDREKIIGVTQPLLSSSE